MSGQVAVYDERVLAEGAVNPIVHGQEQFVVTVCCSDSVRDIDLHRGSGRIRSDLNVTANYTQRLRIFDDVPCSRGRHRRGLDDFDGRRSWRFRFRKPAVGLRSSGRTVDIRMRNLEAKPIYYVMPIKGDRQLALSGVR